MTHTPRQHSMIYASFMPHLPQTMKWFINGSIVLIEAADKLSMGLAESMEFGRRNSTMLITNINEENSLLKRLDNLIAESEEMRKLPGRIKTL